MTLTFDSSPNSSQYSFYPSRILLTEIVLPFGMPPVYLFNIYNLIELVDHGPETKYGVVPFYYTMNRIPPS
jgi:hypothetical protein